MLRKAFGYAAGFFIFVIGIPFIMWLIIPIGNSIIPNINTAVT